MSATRLPVLAPPLNEGGIYAEQLHRRLAAFNRVRFAPTLPQRSWFTDQSNWTAMLRQERAHLEAERSRVADWANAAPTKPDAFADWFRSLEQVGPGQRDTLFPWLAEAASLGEMCWFLTQEISGEAGFDDLVALTQIRMPVPVKLELARNYWDEMGRGNRKGMHGPMLGVLATTLDLHPQVETTVWESLALANTMAGLASHRDYAFQSIGALGVIELTAPGRSKEVAKGLKRLGIAPDARHYFDLHAVLDVKHFETWMAEAMLPLVTENPEFAPAIAEGALMRLTSGLRCFNRYRRELNVVAP